MTFAFSTSIALALVILAAFIDHSEACATAPPSASSESVHVTVKSNTAWSMTTNDATVTKVVDQVKEVATARKVVFFTASQVTKMAEMVDDKLGVHFEIFGAFDKCLRVIEFFQAAVNDAAKDQVVSATVKCGTFDTVEVRKVGML